jgi:photosystem II stability/assembly factor-like uncharacterized protein
MVAFRIPILIFCFSWTFILSDVFSARAWSQSSALAWLEEADLSDIKFVDQQRGFAVGEHGLILATDDGGATWREIKTTVDCRLESVEFIDDQIGWAVGGYYAPHTHRSIAVMLKTVDGGKTWIENRQASLPKLYQVQFIDRQKGWAIGDANENYPSGIFYTDDGGRSWSSSATAQLASWRAAALSTKNSLIAIDQNGKLQQTSLLAREPRILIQSPIHFRQVMQANAELAWAVGEQGWIARSLDGGNTWQTSQNELAGSLQQSDLTAIHAQGNSCWIAANDGARIVVTHDAGKSWSVQETGQSLPIGRLFFLDEQTGWAIASLGTILKTSDGGLHWQVQRGQGRRTTMLAFFPAAESLPLEVFSQIAAGEGRYSALQIVRFADDFDTSQSAHRFDRMRQAAVRLSTSAVDSMMIGPPLDSTESDNMRLQQRLATLIRSWRPSVVLMGEFNKSAAGSRFTQQLAAAIELAAQPTVDPLTGKRLPTWQVAKVLQLSGQNHWLDHSLSSGQYLPRLAKTAEDHAMISHQLIAEKFVLPPEKYGFQSWQTQSNQSTNSGALLTGIPAEPGTNARMLQPVAAGNLDSLRFLTRKQQHLADLMRYPVTSRSELYAWQKQLGNLIAGLTSETAGNTLFQLAMQYNQAGQADLADQSLRLLLNNYADHELAEPAFVWLEQYHASGEVRYAASRNQRERDAILAALLPQDSKILSGIGSYPQPVLKESSDQMAERIASESDDAVSNDPDSDLPESKDLANSVRPADYQEDAPDASQTIDPRMRQRAEVMQVDYETLPFAAVDHGADARRIGDIISQRNGALYQLPQIQFPLAAISRNAAGSSEKARSIQQLKSFDVAGSSFQEFARMEDAMNNQAGVDRYSLTTVTRITQPPLLDGILDEVTWQTIASSRLPIQWQTQVKGDQPHELQSMVMITHDQNFIYLGMRFQKSPSLTYAADSRLRRRDPNLENFDRVRIEIDIDRDYVSFYELELDQRGWVRESRMGDPSWNPKWFVAAKQDDQFWTVEAALPLHELAGQLPSETDAWFLRLRRIPAQLLLEKPTKALRKGLLRFEN